MNVCARARAYVCVHKCVSPFDRVYTMYNTYNILLYIHAGSVVKCVAKRWYDLFVESQFFPEKYLTYNSVHFFKSFFNH